MPLKNIIAVTVAKAILTDCVFVYAPALILLSDIGLHFTSKFFQDIWRILEVIKIFPKCYHQQGNWQVEQSSRTMLGALQSYVADQPKSLDLYTDAITFAFNTQVQRGNTTSEFDLVF